MNLKFIIFFIGIFLSSCTKSSYDIVVVGGGTSGIASAIQSSRLGSKTLLIENSDWLGGMMTSAGVSALDGNYKMPSGFLKEFRDSLVSYYGSLDSLKTGWVSNVMFEPSVGNEILNKIANSEKNLKIIFNSKIDKIKKQKGKWHISVKSENKLEEVETTVLIDATELGDLIPILNIPYYVGMDSSSIYNEKIAPKNSNDIIQDLTYVMILKDYGKDVTIPVPINYNRDEFICSYDSGECSDTDLKLWPKESLISYGKLPNGKYMINWPINGNDYYVNSIHMNEEDRVYHYEIAKQKSIRFLYFIQTEMGYNYLSIDKEEFLTKDGFPKIPYHRESRRIQGKVTLNLNHIANPYFQNNSLYRTGIAVGDYPVDHHHNAHPNYKKLPKLDFYPIPSYSVPLGSLIPKTANNFIVIEKSISVSNLVNGTTRLQPVVMQIGQAAGIAASLAVSQNKPVDKVSVRDIQMEILKNNGYIQPFADISFESPNFISYQKIGACGILRGKGINIGWENKTLFYPEKNLIRSDMITGLKDYYDLNKYQIPNLLTIKNISNWIIKVSGEQNLINGDFEKKWNQLGLKDFNLKRIIKRGEFAILIDRYLNPFSKFKVNFKGEIIKYD